MLGVEAANISWIMTDRLSEDLKSLKIDRSRRTGDAGRNRWILLGALLVIVASIAGVVAFLPEKAGLTSMGAKAREVETTLVVQQSPSADSVVLTAGGYIIPRRRIDLAPKISGRLSEINFEKGDFVKKGQILARLEDQDIQAQLAQSRANRQASEARLKEAVAVLETASTVQTAAATAGIA